MRLYDHLMTSLDTILASHPTAGVIVMGDFNQFDFRRLCRNTSLKQIVKKSTRGNATLDLIFTNMKSWYNDPEILPAIGLSDHMSILLHPVGNYHRPNCQKMCDLFYDITLMGVDIFSPKKLLNCIAETNHGLLLKSNSLSLIDKRLLL